ncbi:alpha/beta fold hydrolase [Polyangium aurulentum]|uniref:alpha/beta fold hydrolase n=1 Tax=Polyangium aurulentum TaxID=2567896 RepID=UPI0010ADAF36|nr:alpha/beta fold hydrolase [Polyangium aurulentum]UQA57545.1 acetylxylan esterase [Polyangium aurulentum]
MGITPPRLILLAALASCGPATPAPAPAKPDPAPPATPTAAAAPRAASSDPFAHDASAPLDVKREGTGARDGMAVVVELSYASARGGRVPARLVLPLASGKHPAVLFQHRGEGSKDEFLEEARHLAVAGIASLAIDAPWLRPENKGKSLIDDARALYEQGAVDLLRGVELLASLPEVDGERIAYVGHSYGAHLGAIVLARSPRVKAAVLMAGAVSMTRMTQQGEHPFWAKMWREHPESMKTLVETMAPIDAEHFIGAAKVPVFHQFADHDEHITYAMAGEYLAKTPDPKVFRFYEADHALNQAARDDRRDFLVRVLVDLPKSPEEERARSRIPGYFIAKLPAAYPLPPSTAVLALPDRVYRKTADGELRLDAYRPAGDVPPKGRPAVVLVHGQTHPALMRDARRWAGYETLARILAARGYVAVVPGLPSAAAGPEPERWLANIGAVAESTAAAVQYVRKNAKELGADGGPVAVWAASAGGMYGVGGALGDLAGDVKCVVALYPVLGDDLLLTVKPPLPAATMDRVSALRALERRGKGAAPMLVVRAGLDDEKLNRSIDDFAKIAAKTGADVTVVRHDKGHHGFELLDATDETRGVLEEVFAFLDRRMGGPRGAGKTGAR